MIASLLVYFVIGALSGFFAGLLGIGGGIILVPALTLLFAARGLPLEHILHVALGTSMATILFTATASLGTHHRRGAVLWPVVGGITPGILAGTALGTGIAALTDTNTLAVLFSVLVIYVTVQMLLEVKPEPSRRLPGFLGLFGAGTGIGVVATLTATGGGVFSVPFLTWCNVRLHQAIGTSAAIGFPIAIGGTLGYVVSGWSTGLPLALGYVYLPALACLVVTGMPAAQLGARTAHKLPVRALRRIFAGLLLLLCGRMLYRLLQA
jgi:uncharacterized membrane protein YfcA